MHIDHSEYCHTGYCYSDDSGEADWVHVGSYTEMPTLDKCWKACEFQLGESLVGVHLFPYDNEGCYCFSDCDYWEVGDENIDYTWVWYYYGWWYKSPTVTCDAQTVAEGYYDYGYTALRVDFDPPSWNDCQNSGSCKNDEDDDYDDTRGDDAWGVIHERSLKCDQNCPDSNGIEWDCDFWNNMGTSCEESESAGCDCSQCMCGPTGDRRRLLSDFNLDPTFGLEAADELEQNTKKPTRTQGQSVLEDWAPPVGWDQMTVSEMASVVQSFVYSKGISNLKVFPFTVRAEDASTHPSSRTAQGQAVTSAPDSESMVASMLEKGDALTTVLVKETVSVLDESSKRRPSTRQLLTTPTLAPTLSLAPTVSSNPTVFHTQPPSFGPTTSEPSALPSPAPTVTMAPTEAARRTPSLWDGKSQYDVREEAVLPFTPGYTSCDPSSSSDASCDSGNNDMTCGFDGGDCCKLSDMQTSPSPTTADDDGQSTDEVTNSYNCKSPYGVHKPASWVQGFTLNEGDDFVNVDDGGPLMFGKLLKNESIYGPQISQPDAIQLWPFQTANGDLTYPFNLRDALVEV